MDDNRQALTLIALAAAGAATGGLALAAAPAVAGGAAATGAAAATATGAAAATAGTAASFSATGAILGASTALTAGGQYMAGQAAALSNEIQAANASLQGAADEAQAALVELTRQEDLSGVLSTQRAIFGSSNLGISSGVAQRLAEDSLGKANRETRIQGVNTSINKSQTALNVSGYKSAAKSAIVTGTARAGGSLLSYADQVQQRKLTKKT